jgi:hypothetical protein
VLSAITRHLFSGHGPEQFVVLQEEIQGKPGSHHSEERNPHNFYGMFKVLGATEAVLAEEIMLDVKLK